MAGLLTFVFIIVVIVGFHESAHFLFMKLWGVKVIRFSIGFGPVLVSRKIGETEYQIAAIPLGGYVLPLSRKMAGEEDYKQYAEPADSGKYFEAKPAWQRMVIYLAGPLSNLLLAFVLYFLLFTCIGLPNPTTTISEVAENYPAAQAGMLSGDKIQFVNGMKINTWIDVQNCIRKSGGRKLKILALRGEERKEFIVAPKVEKAGDGSALYRIGVSVAFDYLKMDLVSAFKEAVGDTWGATMAYMDFFKKAFTGQGDRKSVGGMIMIYQMSERSAEQGLMAIVGLMIMLNMSLFVFNILPIPVLDGGQIYPALFEMATGIRPSEKFNHYWQNLGLLILGSIFILAMWNDISRLLAG